LIENERGRKCNDSEKPEVKDFGIAQLTESLLFYQWHHTKKKKMSLCSKDGVHLMLWWLQ
jgi:hypothetical protein